MKDLLRLEELAKFLFCLFWLVLAKLPWRCYLLFILGPDISMLGYLVNSRVGALPETLATTRVSPYGSGPVPYSAIFRPYSNFGHERRSGSLF